tara:strand:+ start:114 stop:1067 length:954 start_codon:yes stop_codon:yes gene_type:complete
MGKILVKAPQIQLGPNGPQMYYNVGVGGRGGGGNGVRGRTFEDKWGGRLGGAVGVLGGLAGESRSLGGLLSNVQVGAMQGSAVGRGLAGLGTSRRRQARADIREGEKQAQAKGDAQARLAGEREMKRRRGLDFDPNMSLQEMRDMGPTPRRRSILPGIGGKNMTRFGYELADHQSEQQAIAAEQAKREGRERAAMERANLGDDISLLQRVRGMDTEALAAVNQAQPVQTTQMPAAPMKAPEGSVINVGNDAEVNGSLKNPNNMDHQMNTESIQSELGSQDGEGGGQQGQQGQKPPEEFERREGAFERVGQFMREGQQ